MLDKLLQDMREVDPAATRALQQNPPEADTALACTKMVGLVLADSITRTVQVLTGQQTAQEDHAMRATSHGWQLWPSGDTQQTSLARHGGPDVCAPPPAPARDMCWDRLCHYAPADRERAAIVWALATGPACALPEAH